MATASVPSEGPEPALLPVGPQRTRPRFIPLAGVIEVCASLGQPCGAPPVRKTSSCSRLAARDLRACWTFSLPPIWFCPLPPLLHLFALQLAAFVLP